MNDHKTLKNFRVITRKKGTVLENIPEQRLDGITIWHKNNRLYMTPEQYDLLK